MGEETVTAATVTESGLLPLAETWFKTFSEWVALGAECASVVIVAVGVVEAAVGLLTRRDTDPARPFRQKKAVFILLGSRLLLALEFALAADIVRSTIAPTWKDVGMLAAIAVIRTFLNYFLEKDIREFAEGERGEKGDKGDAPGGPAAGTAAAVGLCCLFVGACGGAGTAHARQSAPPPGGGSPPSAGGVAPPALGGQPASGVELTREAAVDARGNVGGAPSRGGDLVFAPVPFSNPTIGAGLGGGLMYVFRPNPRDAASPPSTVALGGLGSENGTKGYFAGGQFYLNGDRLRLLAGAGSADARYDFYGVGGAGGGDGIKVPLAQTVDGFVAAFDVRVAASLFAGLRYMGGSSRVRLRLSDDDPGAGAAIDDRELRSDVGALTPRLLYDTRDSTFFPMAGAQADVRVSLHDGAFGDSFDFQEYEVTYNGYAALGGRRPSSPPAATGGGSGTRKVLAWRAVARTVRGAAPFFGLSQVGMQDGLRGYVSGKYRDRDLLSAQVEYRHMFPNRFGFVAFAGGSAVGPTLSDLGDVLPSVGLGARYQLSPENPINYRIDLAFGDDGSALYFSVGEAF